MPHHASERGPFARLLATVRELIFGLEDGLVSTMGAVTGIAAGTENGRIVILSGLVIIVVEALSMAAGSYLSNKSHRQMLERRIREEREEIEAKPEEEAEELRVMYRQRGFSEDEIAILVRRITADKELWLEEMVSKELRIGGGDLEDPPSAALVMGVSYVIGGAVPVLPYVFLPVPQAAPISIAATLAALFLIGWFKARAAGIGPWKSALEMLFIAAAAAAFGAIIGAAVGRFFGLAL